MPKQTKVCRVCGKNYEACRSVKTGSGVFNWREVACSPECGEVYFRRIEEARNPASKTKTEDPVAVFVAKNIEQDCDEQMEQIENPDFL